MKMFGYWIVFLTVLNDILVTSVAFWSAYYLRFHLLIDLFPLPSGRPAFGNYMILFVMILVSWPATFHITRAYRFRYHRSAEDEFYRILSRVALASVIVWSLALYYRVFIQRGAPSEEWLEPSRLMFLLFMLLDVIGLAMGRSLVRVIADHLRSKGWQIRRSVVIGTGALAKALVERILRHPGMGLQIVGFLDDPHENGNLTPSFQGIKVIGTPSDLPRIIRQQNIDTIFIALPLERYPELDRILAYFSDQPLDIRIVYDTLSHNYLRGTMMELDDMLLIGVNDTPMNGPGFIIKRIMDIVLSVCALVVLSPLLALVAIVIRLTSGSPVIFRQIRMGIDGHPFVMYKFRTMIGNAETRSGPIMTGPDDQRITFVGHILRKFSIDELPQFWNVLIGDMSLVGPRPERPHFVNQFRLFYRQYMHRHRAKGGITGWAQVNGLRGSRTDMEKRIEFDIYYLTRWSVWFDLWILLLTPFRMFRHKGL